MARKPYYTNEENDALVALFNDNPNKRYVDLADLALKYRMIAPWRGRDAVAQHISALINVPFTDDKDDDADITTLILEKKNTELSEKYESLLDAVIGKCELYEETVALKFDYQAIRRWIYHHEPERVSARIEELKAAREGQL